jgi:protein-tyrosine phosphatase
VPNGKQPETLTHQIFEFIEAAMKKTESVLVHSVRGQSRAASVLAVYLMRKYRWSLLKTLDFLNSRRPELEIRGTFIQQLQDYEQRIMKHPLNLGPLSTSWSDSALTKAA